MFRRINCPRCGKQLSVPPDVVGRKVACPRCSNQFRFTRELESQLEAEPSSSVEIAPPNPDLFPPESATAKREARPARQNRSERSRPEQPRAAQAPTELDTARFIERDVDATTVKLGSDGRLPDLALATQDKKTDASEASGSANPWLLITALCLSVLVSLALLLVENPVPGTSSDSKMEARQAITKIHDRLYQEIQAEDSTGASRQPSRAAVSARQLRDLLAHALQAYHRGDLEEERAYYRKVLDFLNREDAPRYEGFSDYDNELKKTIGELLR